MSNCHTCKYRYAVPENAHIGCVLGSATIKRQYKNPEEPLESFIKRTARAFGFDGVKDHGIKNNWCYFPFVFDPVWLEGQCRYYDKEKSSSKGSQ